MQSQIVLRNMNHQSSNDHPPTKKSEAIDTENFLNESSSSPFIGASIDDVAPYNSLVTIELKILYPT